MTAESGVLASASKLAGFGWMDQFAVEAAYLRNLICLVVSWKKTYRSPLVKQAEAR